MCSSEGSLNFKVYVPILKLCILYFTVPYLTNTPAAQIVKLYDNKGFPISNEVQDPIVKHVREVGFPE